MTTEFRPAQNPEVRIANEESLISITSETTMQDVTNLAISGLKANTRYALEALIRLISPAAADIELGWTTPTGSSLQWALAGSNLESEQNNPQTFATSGSAQLANITGTLAIGSTPGTLQFQFAQTTSNAGATSINAGSWIRLTELQGGAA